MTHAKARAKTKTAARKRSGNGDASGGTSPAEPLSRKQGDRGELQRAAAAGPAPTTEPRVAMPVQRQLSVSEPDDTHEREADAVASRVASGGTAGPISPLGPAADEPAQRQGPAPENKRDEKERQAAHRLAQRAMAPAEEPDAVQRAMAPAQEPDAVQRAVAPAEDPKSLQRAVAAAEEPKALQRAMEPAEDPKALRAVAPAEEPKALQRAAGPDELVQASDGGGGGGGGGDGGGGGAAGGGGGAAGGGGGGGAAAAAIAAPGPGQPVAPGTRSTLESRMGVDLGGVRVHDDSAAHDAAGSIDARAFTHGDDIWLARGESQDDLPLMAHEATHVAQQRGGLQRQVAQRAENDDPGKKTTPAAPAAPTTTHESKLGEIDTEATPKPLLKLTSIDLPEIKKTKTPPDFTVRSGPRPETKQREHWNTKVGSLATQVHDKVASLEPVKAEDGTDVYFLEHKDGYVIGSEPTLDEKVRRPSWDKDGNFTFFDVDHVWEHQLGGPDDDTNVWLLESSANRSSGAKIYNEINRKIGAFLKTAPKDLQQRLDVATIREQYEIRVKGVGTDPLPIAGKSDRNYTAEDMTAGKSLEPLKKVPKKEIESLGGKSSRISIFSNVTGGKHTPVPMKDGASTKEHTWGNLRVTKILFGATPEQRILTGVALEKDPLVTAVTLDPGVPILEVPGIGWGGYVSGWVVRRRLNEALEVKGLSAVDLAEVEVDPDQGIAAVGKLMPSIPLLEGVAIELRIGPRGISLRKVFTGDEIKLPGPVKIKGSTLEVELGTQGLAVRGEVPFEIEKLGRGRIYGEAEAGKKLGFELGGEFDFDTEFFKPAGIKVWYRDGKFGGAGKIGIPQGKIRGIKSAMLTVTFDEDHIEAQGDVEVDIKGVQRGSLTVVYDKATGLLIAGTLELATDIPGVKSGKLSAALKQKPEGGWSLGGGITAEVGIPGLSATITGSYLDGVFHIEGTAGYEKGFLKGTVTLGVTNRAVGEDGRPAGEDTGKLIAFGGGTVTVKLAPWLQGTVGLRIKPDGGIVVTGAVALPSTLDLFPEKKVFRNIFALDFDIPIIGFSVLGQRVGIFATVGGGLDADAGIGPGQLRQAQLGVTYDPDDEAATKVSGGANLYIPAHAGLRLFIHGGIGAGIPVVSATAGLEIGAALGVEGALEASLCVEWTPANGLVIDTVLAAYAQPKFKFDISFFVKVTVSYLVGSSTLYHERWKLAAKEYGSDLRFGLRLPIHYDEATQFDVSTDDVEFVYPKIDAMGLLRGLVKELI